MTIAPGADVSRSILWDDVIVERDACLSECIVTDGARVRAGVQLVRSLVLPLSAEKIGAKGDPRGNLLVTPI